MTRLQLWLRGEHLGEVEQLRSGRARLRFSGDALRRWGGGSRPLSLSLPLTSQRVEGSRLDTFLDGLLPEGALRAQLDRRYGARTPVDLLRHIGRECAGAVQFTVDDTVPGAGRLRPLSEDETASLVRDLPTLTPPDDLPLGASLGGVQAKLLLARTASGWAWPTDGAMSTHIIKPQPNDLTSPPLLITAEDWAMRVAAAADLPVARTELVDFDGRQAIVVERYDRAGGERTHQEDFTQALSVPSVSKYESTLSGTARLKSIAQLAAPQSHYPSRFAAGLLEAVAFNTMIGNGDAHSKNYSLTIDSAALVDMAPLYDTAPVMFLGRFTHAGHAVAGQVDLRYITRQHLIDEAVSWGMKPAEADTVVEGVAQRVLDSIEATSVPTELATIVEKVRHRVGGFGS
ncbi:MULTISPECIES: HipA domain-containing protein [Microcella]|uniref:HipA domain-containing protein n=1 Tax=Microcella TaxID=337004 RepID=UPI0015CF6FE6|nr:MULTISPECIES: HipA domain-containing protein [Microcella]MBU1250031.1 HipA domain-containing protein [Actinomycetota bacterium]MBU1609373.1 HipA domain-containing protein [Actinomycetota bacterium]MBU2315005.1 HipA domain-containing protein [Actinomycetota bacterium]MBU2385029.1 HipA domain-containing protein [Actinomycetota bacterium]QOD93221.1 HipA domain-containing protein [Chryseoglobus sp. 28M-23]